MSDPFTWGRARFVGEWTEDAAIAFIERVEEIVREEAEKAAASKDEPA